MKKVLVGLTVLAVVALVAGPALANGYGAQVTVGNDFTSVTNTIYAESWTGGNGIANSGNEKGCFEGNISSNNDGNRITTGEATAMAGAANLVNSNVYLGDACCGPDVQVNKYNDVTWVSNDITAVAVTGNNGIANSGNSMGGFDGKISSNNDDNRITTGDATAYAGAANLVNSNLALTCDLCGDECCGVGVQINKSNDFTMVNNYVFAGSDTGGNAIAESVNSMGGFGGNISSGNDGNVITTGTALSAAGAITVVNTNISRTWY